MSIDQYIARQNAKIVADLHTLGGETILKVLSALQSDPSDANNLTAALQELETEYLSLFMEELEDGYGYVPGLEDLHYMPADVYDDVMDEFRDVQWQYLMVDYEPFDTHADRVIQSMRTGCRELFGAHPEVVKFRTDKQILEDTLRDWGCSQFIMPSPPLSFSYPHRMGIVDAVYEAVVAACGSLEYGPVEPRANQVTDVIQNTLRRVLSLKGVEFDDMSPTPKPSMAR